LLVDKLASEGGAAAIAKGFEDFAALGSAVDGLLLQQVQLDIVALERAAGRTLSDTEKKEIATVQTKAYRYTFLVSGLEQANFLRTVEQLSPAAAVKMREMAVALSA